MTEQLQKVIEQLYALPPEKQDAIATIIQEGILADQKWEELFAKTTDEQWEKMAAEVRREIEEDESIPLEEFLKDE